MLLRRGAGSPPHTDDRHRLHTRPPRGAQESKGWNEALVALLHARAALPHLNVTWICQSAPVLSPAARQLPIRFVINPPQASTAPSTATTSTTATTTTTTQAELPAYYRGEGCGGRHDLLLFASRFEAWGMPILEVAVHVL